ncbi:MAG TPA: ankyrin repeat domain-containing protein, partial [Thermodesulfovibrionales bacterium]|nr:ankyrin repeat domain-containing protein [Thermodesulfovibrionales bacterium]
DVNIKNAKGLSALSCASDSNKTELSRLLLNSGTKADTTATLLQTINTCDEDKVRAILPRGSDANVKIVTSVDSDKNWRTPLLISAEKGCVESVKYLLDIGANPNISNGGFTPLVYAASNGNFDMVTDLIAKGADVNQAGACENEECFHWTPLSYAALNGHIKVVRFLLEKGADVNAMVYDDVEGAAGSALMLASSAGHLDIVKLLLNKGADVSKSDYMENTALIWAAGSGRTQIVAELIANGADVNKKSWDGTALTLARKRKQPDATLIKLLIDAGATEVEDTANIEKIGPETRAQRMKDMQLRIEQRAAQEAKSEGFDIYAYQKDMLNKSSVRVIRIFGTDYIFIIKKFRPEVVIPLWCLMMLMCGLLSYKIAMNKHLDKRFWLIVGALTAPLTLLYIYFIPKRK